MAWKDQDESDCVARELISKSVSWFFAAWSWSNVDSLMLASNEVNQAHLPSRFQIRGGNITNDVGQCNDTYVYIYTLYTIYIMYSMFYLCIYMFIVGRKGVVGI